MVEGDRRDLATLFLEPRQVARFVLLPFSPNEVGVRIVAEGLLELTPSNGEPEGRQVLAVEKGVEIGGREDQTAVDESHGAS
jgi:hypothetical protein